MKKNKIIPALAFTVLAAGTVIYFFRKRRGKTPEATEDIKEKARDIHKIIHKAKTFQQNHDSN